MWERIGLNQVIEKQLMNTEKLTVFKGTGEFTGHKTMKVNYPDGRFEEFESERFIIAAGASSFVPPIKGLDQTGYVVSETFFADKFPQKPWGSLIIVGGGPVGMEFAHIFSALGTKVTMIQLPERLLMREEEEISAFVRNQYERSGINVLTNAQAVSAEIKNGKKVVTVQNTITKALSTVEGEEIFIASGTRSNGDSLKLGNANIETDGRGWIVTNEYLETSQKNIWALGDINGKYQFRHKANYEAEILVNNLFKSSVKKSACYRAVPWAIFTYPQVAHVGITEKEAIAAGMKYHVGKNHYSDVVGGMKMGYSQGDADDGFVKLIVDDDKKIVGVHIVGPQAAILIQPFVYLMNAGFSCSDNNKMKEMLAEIRGARMMCPPLGTYAPIADSMVIHPSLNELTAWAIEKIDWN
jgi:dihydrolipoamide dehydrogenase